MPLPLGGFRAYRTVSTERFQGKTHAPAMVLTPTLSDTLVATTTGTSPITLASQQEWLSCLQWTQRMGHSRALRQQAWQAALERLPHLAQEIVPKNYAARFQQQHFGEESQPPPPPSPEALNWIEQITHLQDAGLAALALEAGGEPLGQLVCDSLSGKSLAPLALYRFLQQHPPKPDAPQHSIQPRFQGGFDPFGATFAVGLATYVYGKIKNNTQAERLGKTLMLVGVIPNLLLMGTAIAAFLKVAFFSGTGLA